MTISPIYGDWDRDFPACAAGKDSTLVGAFLPRHCRLSARIAESSASTIASSARGVEAALAAAEMALLTKVFALGWRRQRADRTITSTFGAILLRPRGRFIPWLRACASRRPCRRRRRSAPPARGGSHPRR